MTLIITAAAAILATAVLFINPSLGGRMRLSVLALIYWGASLMWCVDGFACLAAGEPFVELSDAAAMQDDALLGICVVALGLAAWGIVCAVKSRSSKASIIS